MNVKLFNNCVFTSNASLTIYVQENKNNKRILSNLLKSLESCISQKKIFRVMYLKPIVSVVLHHSIIHHQNQYLYYQLRTGYLFEQKVRLLSSLIFF